MLYDIMLIEDIIHPYQHINVIDYVVDQQQCMRLVDTSLIHMFIFYCTIRNYKHI